MKKTKFALSFEKSEHILHKMSILIQCQGRVTIYEYNDICGIFLVVKGGIWNWVSITWKLYLEKYTTVLYVWSTNIQYIVMIHLDTITKYKKVTAN